MDLSHRSVLNQLGDKPHILLSKRCMIQADTIYVLFHIQCGLLSVELTQDVLCNKRNLARLCVVELNYYKKNSCIKHPESLLFKTNKYLLV